MSAATLVSFRVPVLPWAPSIEDDARFRRMLHRVLFVVALLCLAMLFVPPPQVDRTQPQELPPRLAKLLLEKETPPPPPPVKQEKPKDTKEPSTNKPDPAKPEPPKAATVPEARRPQPNKPPGEVLDNVRRKAAGVGLLAMKDQLAELRGAPVAVQLKEDIKQGPGVGTGVGVGVGAGTEAGLPARSMITSNAAGGSGGINTASYSRNTGGGGLAGRATTLVEGVAGGGGGGGFGGGGVRGGKGTGNGTGAGGTLQKGGSGKASRSIEEIKLVFERNKGSIYAIYNRALREDPSLQGKVVVELKISPAGNVVDCRVVSSELKASELESKLLARIRQFDFGAKDVDQMVVTWPVDFLPS
ncbi:MAG TPA: AgmX/PglI C-terminal domain-containing protein [Albitalea sp.]|uniref:AgmX/PglI C-terminal domain-containing protein n=1 Tax=Piscinibacter sp. TaxID=1903157 RepID=UPI002ED27028